MPQPDAPPFANPMPMPLTQEEYDCIVQAGPFHIRIGAMMDLLIGPTGSALTESEVNAAIRLLNGAQTLREQQLEGLVVYLTQGWHPDILADLRKMPVPESQLLNAVLTDYESREPTDAR